MLRCSPQRPSERRKLMPKATSKAAITTEKGLVIERRFTSPGVHPYDELEWETRDAIIGDPEKPAFEQRDVEFPKTWSQNATNIVAQKYFRGRPGSPERETSVKQMVSRVADRIAEVGREQGYFATDADADAFDAELTSILVNQKAAFNSPVWFNVGWKDPGSEQASACFILSVEDDMDSILSWNTKEGIIFKGGSGSGINLSKIRGSMEPLSKGGIASGPVSFMRGADSWAGAIMIAPAQESAPRMKLTGPLAMPPLERGSIEPRILERLIPEPEPPLKMIPSLVFQERMESMSSSTERMKQADACSEPGSFQPTLNQTGLLKAAFWLTRIEVSSASKASASASVAK